MRPGAVFIRCSRERFCRSLEMETKFVEYISRMNVAKIQGKICKFQKLIKLCDITAFHETLCYSEKFYLDMTDRDRVWRLIDFFYKCSY